jgi:hypothetical protein
MTEEKAFWTLVQIMYKYNWRELFIEGTPKLVKLIEQLES